MLLIYIKESRVGRRLETERQIELPDDERNWSAPFCAACKAASAADGGVLKKKVFCREPLAAPAPETKQEEVEEGYRSRPVKCCRTAVEDSALIQCQAKPQSAPRRECDMRDAAAG